MFNARFAALPLVDPTAHHKCAICNGLIECGEKYFSFNIRPGASTFNETWVDIHIGCETRAVELAQAHNG